MSAHRRVAYVWHEQQQQLAGDIPKRTRRQSLKDEKHRKDVIKEAVGNHWERKLKLKFRGNVVSACAGLYVFKCAFTQSEQGAQTLNHIREISKMFNEMTQQWKLPTK